MTNKIVSTNAKADMSGMYQQLGSTAGNVVKSGFESMVPEDPNWRKNPYQTTRKKDKLRTTGTIGGSVLSGAGTGAAIGSIVPGIGTAIGAIVGAAVGGISSGALSAATRKRRVDKALHQESDWSNSMAQISTKNNSYRSFANGGEKVDDNGGKIVGSGTAKSDSISKNVEDGSFIVPAENAQKAMNYGKTYLNWKDDELASRTYPGTETKLSNGEVLFTPEEKNILLYHGVDVFGLAPNAESSTQMAKGGEKYATKEFDDFTIKQLGLNPDITPEEIKTMYDDEYPDASNTTTESSTSGNEEKKKSAFEKVLDFSPEVLGGIQSAIATTANIKAGSIPDINVSESLRRLVTETRQEAQYGLEPGTIASMENQTEKARRDATNAIVSRGGSSAEMMSNLQSILGTTIDKKYNIELENAAEKSRKKGLYFNSMLSVGDQEYDVKKQARQDWLQKQDVNASLLSAGISNIVGARKFKIEQDRLREIGSSEASFS